MTEQDIINSLEFAQKSLEIHGKIAISQLPRLHDVLRSNDGELDYHLKGGINAQGKPALWLQVSGQVVLTCQRCLGAIEFPLDLHANFVVVPSEEALPAPEDEHDEMDYLVTDPEMRVWQLVEDEVLLGLPLASKHVDSNCASGSAIGAVQKKENPFKILQGLKLNKD